MDEPFTWRLDLTFAVDRWRGGPATLYAPGHALFFALLAAASPAAARLLHDLGQRKPLALSPLRLDPVTEDVARATLSARAWDPALIALIERAAERLLDFRGQIVGHPTAAINLWPGKRVPLAVMLNGRGAPASVVVRFDSPTFFSLGRSFGGQRYELLPVPELVVGSWLRAWVRAGGEAFGAETTPGWLAERVAIREIAGLTTTTVNGGKTALTGFRGTVRLAWVGPEPWGRALLAALARFAAYCGTGAKTGFGFGLTTPLAPTGSTILEPAADASVVGTRRATASARG